MKVGDEEEEDEAEEATVSIRRGGEGRKKVGDGEEGWVGIKVGVGEGKWKE